MIKIGDYSFDVPAPPAMRTFSLQQRILPVVGRVLGVLFSIGGKAVDTDLTKLKGGEIMALLPQAAPAIGEVFAAMPPGELEDLTRELLRDATVDGWGGASKVKLFDGPGGAFDAVMKGRSLDVWKLLWHALEVWYPDFFALAASSNGGAEKASR